MQLFKLKKDNQDLGFFLKMGNQYIKIQFVSNVQTIKDVEEVEYDFDGFGKGVIVKEVNMDYIG